METNLIEALITLVKETSPSLWAIGLQKVQSATTEHAILAMIFLILSVVALVWSQKNDRASRISMSVTRYEELRAYVNIGKIVAVVMFFIALFHATIVYRGLTAPEYHALEFLVDLVK